MNEPQAGQEAAPVEPGAPAAPELDLAVPLAAAQALAAENHDLYMRARADMENVRRRAEEDIAKARKFSIESFAENLLPVVDSVEKALEISAGQTGPMRDGLELTQRQLIAALERSGMKPIDPMGEKFDPHTQQAISMIAAPEVPSGHVAAVFQRGWLIADRVLRPAMVAVSQG
ncbi:MAG: nucleotide exchange factor GrpE [Burkholderiaceae bacterium]